jgi:hypothetical protein
MGEYQPITGCGISRLVSFPRRFAFQPALDLRSFPTFPAVPLWECAGAHPAIQRASMMVDDSYDIRGSEQGVLSQGSIAASATSCDGRGVTT